MAPLRALRMAWAGTIAAAVSGFLYLAHAPIPASRTTGTLLTLGCVALGAMAGAGLVSGLESSLRSQRSHAAIIRLPADAEPLKRVSARGA